MSGRRSQRGRVIDIVLLFVLVLWTVQLFLLMTGLDAFMGGETRVLWPAALSSLALAAVNVTLVRGIRNT